MHVFLSVFGKSRCKSISDLRPAFRALFELLLIPKNFYKFVKSRHILSLRNLNIWGNLRHSIQILNLCNRLLHKYPSEYRTEYVSDGIMDCLYSGFGEMEFKARNRYYATLNPRDAAEYQRFDDEIMEDDK